jgi:ectoine hydroxylase-related dioxygenase (phytanoyl-CoA dioxygenase family)
MTTTTTTQDRTASTAPPYADWRAIITPEVRRQYKEDGVVLLRQALHPEWLTLIELGMRRRLANPDAATFYKGQEGSFKETVRNFDVTPEIQRLLYDSPIADMMSMLLGSENIYYYSDEFFIKEGFSKPTPWHQDMPYWPLEGEQIASMWLSLDPLSREECLESIPGSHRLTRYDGFSPGDEGVDPTKGYYGQDLPRLPDIEAERDKWNIVAWDMQPGDVILLHPGVLHGGGPMAEGGRRRTITIRCYGDDIVYAERPPSRPTVPMTPGLSQKLKPGDPLRHPWYPQLRPLPAHQIVR